ncbi:MAG TPA: hypothetical protein VK172_03185 [Lentimicrobium sp.]|nr:hypothetical protein [Lentimicrobium sp.]
MKKLILLILLALPVLIYGQSWKSKPFSISVLNNATLMPPASLTAVFNQPIHPGISLGYEFGWRETIRSPLFQNINVFDMGGREVYTGKWFQTVELSYFHHRYVNQAMLLTSHFGYRKYIRKFSAELSLHAGYMHALLFTERFTRQENGTWDYNRGLGRAYFVGGAGVGLGYDAGYRYNVRRFFVNYDFRLQMPFVRSYVPLLPNGILSVGMQFTLFKNAGSEEKSAPTRLPCPKS